VYCPILQSFFRGFRSGGISRREKIVKLSQKFAVLKQLVQVLINLEKLSAVYLPAVIDVSSSFDLPGYLSVRSGNFPCSIQLPPSFFFMSYSILKGANGRVYLVEWFGLAAPFEQVSHKL